MNSRLRAALAASSCALLLATGAACGGSDAGGGGGAALSADEFRTKADAICKDYRARIKALPEPTGPSDIGAYFEKALPLVKEEYAKLRELTPPAELKADMDATMALLDQVVAKTEDVQKRIAGGEDALTVIGAADAEINRINDEAKAKAVKMGLKECGNDSDGDTTSTPTTSTTSMPPLTTPGTTPTTPMDPTTTPVDPTTTPIDPTTTPVDTDFTSTDAAPTGSVDMATFVKDATEFGTTLQEFGLGLQTAATSPEALKSQATELRGKLDTIDAIKTRMAGYTLDDATLDAKRSKLVEATPDVTRLGRELLDAAEAGDSAKVKQIASEFPAALERLTAAVN